MKINQTKIMIKTNKNTKSKQIKKTKTNRNKQTTKNKKVMQ